MNVLNLTPHNVNILKKDSTIQQRSGKIVLHPDISLEDALLYSFKPEANPLNVPPESNDLIWENIPCYSPIAYAEDNYGLYKYFTDHRPYQLNSRFEAAEMIIVSQRCANYINARITHTQFPPNDIVKMNLMDKFYVPFNMVYPNRKPGSASRIFTGHKPLGALGLQKVSSCWELGFYAQAIRMNLTVSTPGLCVAAGMYAGRAIRDDEDSLRVVNQYLVNKLHYNPYL